MKTLQIIHQGVGRGQAEETCADHSEMNTIFDELMGSIRGERFNIAVIYTGYSAAYKNRFHAL